MTKTADAMARTRAVVEILQRIGGPQSAFSLREMSRYLADRGLLASTGKPYTAAWIRYLLIRHGIRPTTSAAA
jgi:hypothetical protein